MASTAAVKKAAEVEGLIANVLGTSNGSNSYEASMKAFDAQLARIDLEMANLAQVRWCSPCSNSGQSRDDDGALGICTSCCCGECGADLDAFKGNCINPKCTAVLS